MRQILANLVVMGGLCSRGGAGRHDQRGQWKSNEIQKRNKRDYLRAAKVTKLLLLGPGESGKSTVFKQANQLFGDGFTEPQRIAMADIVYNNLYLGMKALLKSIPKDRHSVVFTRILGLQYDSPLTKHIQKDLETIWKDPIVQNAWLRKDLVHCPYALDYFMERLPEIASPGYIPSNKDLIWTRARTTGIVEFNFCMHDSEFTILDVGGQRNERKKWINCFDKVTAIIFVVAVSDYDQFLVEDPTCSRMDEALLLFEQVCNLKEFASVPILLFLNKIDLLAETLARSPLRNYMDDYFGIADDVDAACNFIKFKFEGLNHDPNKTIYTHITCATDEQSMQDVFDDVRKSTLQQDIVAVKRS